MAWLGALPFVAAPAVGHGVAEIHSEVQTLAHVELPSLYHLVCEVVL